MTNTAWRWYCQTPLRCPQQVQVEEVTCLSPSKVKGYSQLEDTLRQVQQIVKALINLCKMSLLASWEEGVLRWNLGDLLISRKLT